MQRALRATQDRGHRDHGPRPHQYFFGPATVDGVPTTTVYQIPQNRSLMPPKTIEDYTLDDLQRRQEEPVRKRRRLSVEPDSESEGEDAEASTSSDREEPGHLQGRGLESESGSDDDFYHAGSRQSGLVMEDRLGPFPRVGETSKWTTSAATSSTTSSSFSSFGISLPLQNALKSMSIKQPTEVQTACIPPLLAGEWSHLNPTLHAHIEFPGRDCIGNAKTGSGKTIAFALPILQRLSVDPYGIFALVLTPTR